MWDSAYWFFREDVGGQICLVAGALFVLIPMGAALASRLGERR